MPRTAAVPLLLILLFPALLSPAVFAGEPRLEYYGEIGCSHCDLFKEKILPSAEKEAGITVAAEYYDILSEEGFERCEERLAEMGYSFSVFPVLIIGNNAYQGNSAVEAGLAAELVFYAENGSWLPRSGNAVGKTAEPLTRSINPAFLPVFLAGLADGVNPCAFATMLFFLSWITLKGGSGKRVIVSGSGFITGVFLAYLAIGFGLFSFFRAAESMAFFRAFMRGLFTAVSLLFALLSLRDAVVIKRTGKPGAMVLRLPEGLKKRIHSVIRRSEASGGRLTLLLFPALMVTGAAVALLELACTGQIYFPAIAFMVQSGGGTAPLLWLLLYNGAFILPLLLVFAAVLAGASQKKIGAWFSRNLAAGKTASALLFFLLAAVIWMSG